MEIREQNKKLLINYFEKGIKKKCIEKLGVELEHLLVKAETKETVSYYGENGIEAILEEMSVYFPHRFEKDGRLIGIYNNDYSISLEPAGQLEVSIVPKDSIHLVDWVYDSFLEKIQPILDRNNYELLTLGYQPKDLVTDLKLIPKMRYELMDRYFKETGTCGINMMRGTAATQVSIDYCSEEDFVLKIRAAYLLMPLLELLTDNSPIFEGQPYEKNMLRSYIWNNVDPKRAGIIPDLFEEDFGFDRYAEYLLKMPPIFDPAGECYTEHKSTEEVWSDRLFTEEDIDHVLSMSFSDVRLKSYIEIRYADSMPMEYVDGYLALIKGIFYNQQTLEDITDKLTGGAEAVKKAQESLANDGFDGKAYGYEAWKLLSYLLEQAKNNILENEQLLLLPLEKIIESKRTLAKEYYENNLK